MVNPTQIHDDLKDNKIVSRYAILQLAEYAVKLEQIVASCYQIAGALDLDVSILDVLSDPANATQEQVDNLLPFIKA